MGLKRYKLGDLIEVTRGQSLAGEFYAEEGKYIRLTLGNFDYANGGFKPNTSKTNLYYTGPIKEQFILEEGDIITPLTEQTPGLLGSTARIPISGTYIQSQDVALVRCKDGMINPAFCYYLLPSSSVKKQLAAGAQQTKIRHTSPDKIRDVVVDIPDISEQRRIGQLLDAITHKIELNRSINQNLEALAKQLYDYWFVQFDFPDEQGKPYKSSGGKMVWNEKLKREIPVKWEVKSLSSVAIVNQKSLSKEDILTEIEYLDTSSLTENNITETQQIFKEEAPSRAQRKVKQRTILYSTVRPRLKHYGILCNPASNLIVSTGFATIDALDIRLAYYIYYVLTQKSITEYLGSIADTAVSSYPSINPTDLESINVVIPDERLIKAFDETISPLYELKEDSAKTIQTLIKQRDELLPLLMNGQVSLNSDLSHN